MEFAEAAAHVQELEARRGDDWFDRWLGRQSSELTARLTGLGDENLRASYRILRELLENLQRTTPAPPEAPETTAPVPSPNAQTAPTTPPEPTEPAEPVQQAGTTVPAGVARGEKGESVLEPTPVQVVEDVLGAVWHELRADGVAGAYARSFERSGGVPRDGARLWEWLHLLALRLPPQQAEALRERAWDAVAEAAERVRREGHEGEFLVPPLPSIGYPGLRGEPVLQGRRLAEGLSVFAELAGKMFRLARHDPAVRLAYSPVGSSRERLLEFDQGNRESYDTQFRSKLEQLARDPGTIALLDVDEGVRGVVPIPLPAPGSRWSQWLAALEGPLSTWDVALPPTRTPYEQWRHDKQISDIQITRDDAAPLSIPSGNIAWILRGYPKITSPSNPKTRDKKGPRVAYVAYQ